MRKHLLITTMTILILSGTAFAQVNIGVGIGRGYGGFRSSGRFGRTYPAQKRRNQALPKFDPIVRFSLGYGYPNLDANQLAGFYNYSRGTVTQTGPITGALDYQYNRFQSIGLLVTHGQVSAPYYNYNNPTGSPDLSGTLDNWSVMLNFMNYLPSGGKLSPYFRTAVGLNIWDQHYTDASGAKLNNINEPNQFAYQLGLGANLALSKNTGLFLEAGYGKYIVHAGLSFKL
jgi:opacity protein-like surface antigen